MFHLVKNKVETFTPTFQFVLHPARLLPHPQNIFTVAFPACPHAFCLPAGSGHPVRTISYNNLHRINLFQHPQPFVPYIDGCVIVPVHFVPAYGTIICPYIQRHLLTMPATGTYHTHYPMSPYRSRNPCLPSPSYPTLPRIQRHTVWLSQYLSYAGNPSAGWRRAGPF